MMEDKNYVTYDETNWPSLMDEFLGSDLGNFFEGLYRR
jgi:hypothetical protein